MRHGLTFLACFVAGFSGWEGAHAITLFGPKGSFSVMFNDLAYDPSRACTKPFKPYRPNSSDIDAYAFSMDRYRSCLKGAASDDIDYAIEVIKKGYAKSLNDREF